MAIDEDLGRFVREALDRSVPREQIREVLVSADWSPSDVDEALRRFAEVDFPLPVPRPRPSLSAREAFEYLVLFSTLYLCAFSLGRLIFQFIEIGFPDSSDYTSGHLRAIRWSIASLVVGSPVFLYMARRNARQTARSPLLRASPVRRWLTYLTLAISACVLIGDSVSLVYNLLAGELTVRFLLKAATIALIAGSAFYYYLSDLRRDEPEQAAQGRTS